MVTLHKQWCFAAGDSGSLGSPRVEGALHTANLALEQLEEILGSKHELWSRESDAAEEE